MVQIEFAYLQIGKKWRVGGVIAKGVGNLHKERAGSYK